MCTTVVTIGYTECITYVVKESVLPQSKSLLDEIERLTARKADQRSCSIKEILLSLGDKDRADLQLALDNPNFTHAIIREVLVERGHSLSASTVSRHRRRQCGCTR